MMPKEKIKDILFYLYIVIFAIVVWYASYNFGAEYFRGENIPIGQEYRIKDIVIGENSTFVVKYYDNDEKHTERAMIPTDYNQFNFTQSNSSIAMLKLEKIENGANYWNIYIPKNES